MNRLIGIPTCWKNADRAQAIRETWGPKCAAAGFDLRFFIGALPVEDWKRPDGMQMPPDTIHFDIPDDYLHLPLKVQAMCKWAVTHGYEELFKTDDDCYVVPELLAKLGLEGRDYVGRFREPGGGYPAWYASGFAYWLSGKAMAVIIETSWNGDWPEDRWVGNVLAAASIQGWCDMKNYAPAHPPLFPVLICDCNVKFATVFCEFHDTDMFRDMHARYSALQLTPAAPMPLAPVPLIPVTYDELFRPPIDAPKPRAAKMDFSKITILLKTLLRDEHLYDAVAGIQKTMPSARILVVDDGEPTDKKNTFYTRLREQGHTVLIMPWDSGFGAKSNIAVQYMGKQIPFENAKPTPYLLIGSDDFDFAPFSVREGIEKMIRVLEMAPDIAIAGGWVNGRAYDYWLDERLPMRIYETALKDRWSPTELAGDVPFHRVDMTVNYCLIRGNILGFGPGQVHWDSDVKIGGGEHGAFFWDVKKAGFHVAHVPGVRIEEQKFRPNKWTDPRYGAMRRRAMGPERPCFVRRGILQWGSDYVAPGYEAIYP